MCFLQNAHETKRDRTEKTGTAVEWGWEQCVCVQATGGKEIVCVCVRAGACVFFNIIIYSECSITISNTTCTVDISQNCL